MDDANKILDVTYGSFACRLEGFEDSVETMKTVVMYFHDLAGHDRFMDMEPQAPDLEELARLTEEQTGTSVDIEGEGQRVSLRAGAALTAAHDDEDDDLATELETLADEDWDADTAEDADEAETSGDADAEDDDAMIDDDAVEKSVAEKLQHIKDVVAQNPEEDAAHDAAETDDGEANDTGIASAAPLAAGLGAVAGAASQMDWSDASDDDPTDDMDFEGAESEDFADDIVEKADEADDVVEAMSEEDDASDFDAEEMSEDADVAEDTMDTAAEDDVVAEEDNIDVAEDDTAEEEDATDDVAEDDQHDDLAAEAEEVAEEAADEDSAEPEAGPLVLTSRDAALAGDDTADQDHEDDDFDLQAEVAKVEAELAARSGNSMARHGLPRSVDDAMSRILSQTDQHLNQPESRRHRDAFAQLKAAVAATEAARQLGDAGTPAEDPDEAYKDDLGAHNAQELADAQDDAPKAPPLKLVQGDIVETAPTDAATPEAAEAPASRPTDAASARLREIAARKENASKPVSAVEFKDFAESQGAADVIDMIEAAAAYLYYVEGDADFSRPQVMKKVQAAIGKEISREDGLRAFGRLLRLAKIVKLNNGRFRISENSEYRPDDAQAAQG